VEGWIKLHRDFLDWQFYKDNKVKALFIHLLLLASYSAAVETGKLQTTIRKLKEETGLTTQEIRTALDKLQCYGTITQETTPKYHTIKIVNWELYQNSEHSTGGWIKLYRQLLDWEWYKNLNVKIVWLHLLLTANFVSGRKAYGHTLVAGQVITTYKRIAEETGLTFQNVRTAINHLLTSGEITKEPTNKFQVITVEKWAFFQYQDGKDNNNPNRQLTYNQQSTNNQLTSVKEESKKERREKGKNYSIGRPKQNRFVNYPQSYTPEKIREIERQEQLERLRDIEQLRKEESL